MKLKRHRGFALLGVIAVSATGVLADQPAGLSFSCTGGARTEAAHVAELCADFLQAVQEVMGSLWGFIAAGQRDVRPSVGIMTMDTTLTRSRRLAFFQRLLADLPR